MTLTAAMIVRSICRQVDHAAVAHTALGNDVVGKLLHFRAAAFEQRNLKTAVVIKVHMQCRLREIVPLMKVARQPSWKIAYRMVVDVDQRGDTGARTADFEGGLLQAGSSKITDCLRPIGISARAHKTVDLLGKIIVNRNGQARHGLSPGGSVTILLLCITYFGGASVAGTVSTLNKFCSFITAS
jgi:hypothetical protein